MTLNQARFFLMNDAHFVKRVNGKFEPVGRAKWLLALAVVQKEIERRKLIEQ
jgi:hypothetical protein